MRGWDAGALGAYLPSATVLGQMEAAVVVADRLGNLLYANTYAAGIFDFPDDGESPLGRPLLSLGFADGEVGRAAEMTRQVLRGRSWDGTFATARADGARVFVRAQAVPLRHPSGAIDGVVLIARRVSGRGSERERDRIALLERIGDRLSRSLEVDVTLRHVAQSLVPQFADHCFIDLFYGDKLIRRAQVNAGDWVPPPESWARVGEQISYPEGHFCQQAMARMEPVVVSSLADEHFPAPHQESLRASEDVGLVSIVAAPLAARGELLGVMSLALSRLTDREELRYDAEDRDFLGAVASRIAIAIDNAMLFEEERRTALAFQTSLLPRDLPAVDGLEAAWRYVPAKPLETHGQGIQTQVGGDWYDLIPLSSGRVGLAIGDVEGRGARAAAVMGQVRATLRAYAQDDKPPAEILRKLDDWCRTLGASGGAALGSTGTGAETDPYADADPPMVSCTYLVYDPWSRMLSFANAGHGAPLVITADGDVSELHIENKGVLLGVRGKGVAGLPTYREETCVLPPGSTLLLYTDGLTDRRQRPDGDGHLTHSEAVEILRAAVGRAAGQGAQAIARAAEEAVPGVIDDDMAIVAVTTSRTNLDSWEKTFPAEAVRVSEARRRAQAAFDRWGVPDDQSDLACLLVSEVVTNVVLHTGGARRRPAMELEPAGASWAAGGLGPGGAALSPPQPRVSPDWEGVAFLEDSPPPRPRQFTLRLRHGAKAIWVEVQDSDLRMPRIRTAGETDEGGRGLYLVDQLAARWGSRPTRDGKAVWFEIPIDGEAVP